MVLKFFLDLDGVFADFNRGVYDISGKYPSELPKNRMWSIVHSKKDFFGTLELMPRALELWEYVKPHNPTFLTGAPSSKAFQEQKVAWVNWRFGPYETIVLPRKRKQEYSEPGAVLIDDTEELIDAWRLKGGFGFLYKGDPTETIAQIEEIRAALP